MGSLITSECLEKTKTCECRQCCRDFCNSAAVEAHVDKKSRPDGQAQAAHILCCIEVGQAKLVADVSRRLRLAICIKTHLNELCKPASVDVIILRSRTLHFASQLLLFSTKVFIDWHVDFSFLKSRSKSSATFCACVRSLGSVVLEAG